MEYSKIIVKLQHSTEIFDYLKNKINSNNADN